MKFKFHGKDCELIMLGLTGSRLYGTNTTDSDFDLRGIFIIDHKEKLGIDGFPEQIHDYNLMNKILKELKINIPVDDIVLYEIRHFFKLAAQNNPNIIDILFMPSSHIYYSNYKWDKVRNNKDLFLSKKIKHTFLGYAHSQLHRMKTFKGEDMESKRAVTFEKYGFDTKNALHLCRLLIAAKKILITGEYNPKMSTEMRKFLLEIKSGKFSYEWIKDFSNKLEKDCIDLYEKTNLQHKPNLVEINKMLVELSM